MSKVRKKFVGSAVTLLVAGLCTGLAFAEATKLGFVNVEVLNLRQAPSTASKVLTKAAKGAKLSVVGQSADWYKVNYQGSTAWVASDYVTIRKETTATTASTATVNGSTLNVRKTPDTSAAVVMKLLQGAAVSVVTKSGNWYQISYEGKTGWVSAEYLSFTTSSSKATASSPAVQVKSGSTGVISGEKVNLRSSASTDAKVLETLTKGKQVSLLGTSGDWYKVKSSSGKTGWILKGLVTASASTAQTTKTTAQTTAKTTAAKTTTAKTTTKKAASRGGDDVRTETQKAAGNAGSSAKGQRIISYAKQFLGTDYKWGGTTPSGFDCSGFTQYVFSKNGISLQRTAASQSGQGTKVSKSALKPGDLVFFDTNGGKNNISHVGIYVGGGKFIHASTGHDRVMITDLNSGYYAGVYMWARRIGT